MHFIRTALLASLFAGFALTACGGDDDSGDSEAFDTFQDCFTDHHVEEGFDVQKAITICCIDHPIGGQDANVVCGNDATACEAYVTANLGGSDAGSADITAACTDYVTKRGM
jgi:hypothetical protein